MVQAFQRIGVQVDEITWDLKLSDLPLTFRIDFLTTGDPREQKRGVIYLFTLRDDGLPGIETRLAIHPRY